MPRRCTACKMVGGKGHGLHLFPKVEKFRRLWVSAVKLHRKDFDGATSTSLLCSRHFTEDCYVIEGQRYRDECGILGLHRFQYRIRNRADTGDF